MIGLSCWNTHGTKHLNVKPNPHQSLQRILMAFLCVKCLPWIIGSTQTLHWTVHMYASGCLRLHEPVLRTCLLWGIKGVVCWCLLQVQLIAIHLEADLASHQSKITYSDMQSEQTSFKLIKQFGCVLPFSFLPSLQEVKANMSADRLLWDMMKVPETQLIAKLL